MDDISDKISLDLIQKAQHELEFLKQVDDAGILYKPRFVASALYRYEKFWLPLLRKISKNSEEDLKFAPPIDVLWVWHTHMLCPTKYARDCEKHYGRVFNHELRSSKDFEERRTITRDHWAKEFPQMSYDQPDYFPTDFKTLFEYDIAAAVDRQRSFYYQVSLPHFKDENFLKQSQWRYLKYLHLKSKYPKEFLVPCYDMDLMWHVHQAHPIAYLKETEAIIGEVLSHDDSVNDRSKGSKLNTACDKTVKLWQDTFGNDDHFCNHGSMYRGEPVRGKMALIQDNLLSQMRSQPGEFGEIILALEEVEVPDIKGRGVEKLQLQLKVVDRTNVTPKLIWEKTIDYKKVDGYLFPTESNSFTLKYPDKSFIYGNLILQPYDDAEQPKKLGRVGLRGNPYPLGPSLADTKERKIDVETELSLFKSFADDMADWTLQNTKVHLKLRQIKKKDDENMTENNKDEVKLRVSLAMAYRNMKFKDIPSSIRSAFTITSKQKIEDEICNFTDYRYIVDWLYIFNDLKIDPRGRPTAKVC